VTQRLQAMDQLWDSLNRSGEQIASPDWHQDVLADRKARAQRIAEVSNYLLDSILTQVSS